MYTCMHVCLCGVCVCVCECLCAHTHTHPSDLDTCVRPGEVFQWCVFVNSGHAGLICCLQKFWESGRLVCRSAFWERGGSPEVSTHNKHTSRIINLPWPSHHCVCVYVCVCMWVYVNVCVWMSETEIRLSSAWADCVCHHKHDGCVRIHIFRQCSSVYMCVWDVISHICI